MLIQTLKGFRDFLPPEARKRQYIVNTLKEVFELYGFEPLETPALEYDEILSGKYGEEGDTLMYRFTDRGGRHVALRYDQTVPLARVVAQYANSLPLPFKRYQIQPVWRAENPQKGRFREFLQCDIDIVASSSPLADAEIISIIVDAYETLGFKNFKVLINDRKNLSTYKTSFDIDPKKIILIVRSIDKLKKIGYDGVLNELIRIGFTEREAKEILDSVEKIQPSENLNSIFSYLKTLGVPSDKYEFLPTLARGLDYYTGIIFEVEVPEYTVGSLGGGGRYDNLIGIFAGRPIPAVGFSFGFDRIVEAMEIFNLFPEDLITSKVLVTIFAPEFLINSIEISYILRANNIPTELYLEPETKMERQLKYADQKGIPFVVIIGPEEIKDNKVTLKNLKKREQKRISVQELANEVQKES